MRKGNFFCALFLFLAAAMLFNPGTAHADVTGAISGQVQDPSGGVIAGVHITSRIYKPILHKKQCPLPTGPTVFWHCLLEPTG